MALNTWLIYLLAVIGLSLSPGPNGLLALTHGVLHGARRTIWTISGGAVGFVLVIALSMAGIGALLKASVVWFTVLKWAGAAYLIWLGIQVWRSPAIGATLDRQNLGRVTGLSLFRQGWLSATTNPKAILFFAAFLPQFIDPNGNLWLQFLILAGTFAVVEFLYELLVASTASRIRPWLVRVGRRFNQTCGAIFMGLGALLPFKS